MAYYERLSPLDRTFLDLEYPNTHMHVAGVMTFEAAPMRNLHGGIDIERLRRYVSSRLHLIPRYRQRITRIPIENHPVWIDDDRFNINYHVRHTALPQPGDDETLKRLASRIVSQQLDRGKPLWELWVIEGLSGDRFAVISKTHHCMTDGVSAIDLAAVLLSPAPEAVMPEGPRWEPRPAPTPGDLFLDEVSRRLDSPFELGRSVLEALQKPSDAIGNIAEKITAVGETLGKGLFPASASPFNLPIGPHRRFDWTTIELNEIKRIKNSLGGTVNDVVLAIVAGAVGKFLRMRGLDHAKIAQLDFRAMVPVSVRSQEQRGTLGNRIASWAARLPIAEDDPVKRLKKVRDVTDDLKSSRLAMGAEVLAAVSEWTVATLLSLAMRLAARARSFNLTVTNIPGPQLPLYLLGSRMQAAYPLAPLFENQALNIALLSYNGTLFWGLNADYEVLPDLKELVKAIDDSCAEMTSVVAARSSSRKRKAVQTN
ncbi:MAG TPA: wax ester/triacylglycerol synthase family O-acyltransferase [Candidatus Binataceae bacterium]|nr:wax ester/triacylglycerol synthase family O-acyltransferase [Candidatus Binataceae bacterium]